MTSFLQPRSHGTHNWPKPPFSGGRPSAAKGSSSKCRRRFRGLRSRSLQRRAFISLTVLKPTLLRFFRFESLKSKLLPTLGLWACYQLGCHRPAECNVHGRKVKFCFAILKFSPKLAQKLKPWFCRYATVLHQRTKKNILAILPCLFRPRCLA